MARRKTQGRNQGRQSRPQARQARFVFEPGEKDLALPVKTISVEIGAKGEEWYKYIPTPPSTAIPDHLRGLGVRIHLKLVGEDLTFLEGPSTPKTLTKDLKLPLPATKEELPSYKVVGVAGQKGMVIVSYSLKYKDT